MKTTLNRVIASIMLVILTTAPTYAACGPDNCLGPCNYEELLFDTRFSGNCPEWKWTGFLTHNKRVQIGSNWLAELGAPGSLSQTVSTGSYSSMEVGFDVYVEGTNPGSERLYVEILRGYSLLETVEVIYPSSGDGFYSMSIGNYSDDEIKIRFRRVNGTTPGDTVFRIDNAVMFGYN